MQAMRGLDLGICKAILFELEQRVAKGEVKKPQGLCSDINPTCTPW